MSFSERIKKLKIELIDVVDIDLDLIKCQYNPDRFNVWKAVCGDLEIESSPFYYYLSTGKTSKYEELFRGYGRSDLWITNNIIKFNVMVESIKKEGVKELPDVLTSPVISNPYNSGFEIWEGHRRISIRKYFGIKQRVRLCRASQL